MTMWSGHQLRDERIRRKWTRAVMAAFLHVGEKDVEYLEQLPGTRPVVPRSRTSINQQSPEVKAALVLSLRHPSWRPYVMDGIVPDHLVQKCVSVP